MPVLLFEGTRSEIELAHLALDHVAEPAVIIALKVARGWSGTAMVTIAPRPFSTDAAHELARMKTELDIVCDAPPRGERPVVALGEAISAWDPQAQRFQTLPLPDQVALSAAARGVLGRDVAIEVRPPPVLLQFQDHPELVTVDLRADTLRLDPEADRVEVVFRGFVLADDVEERPLERVFVGEPRSGAFGECDVFWATRQVDAERARPPRPMTEGEKELERMAAFTEAALPGPTLDVDAYARASFALAAAERPRAEILDRLGFDEMGWTAEEVAWAMRFAEEDAEAPSDIVGAYAQTWREEEAALGAVLAERFDRARYRELVAAMEREAPHRVLGRADLNPVRFSALARVYEGERDRAAAEGSS